MVRVRCHQFHSFSSFILEITPSQKLVSVQLVMLVASKYLNDASVLQSVMHIIASILKDKGNVPAGISSTDCPEMITELSQPHQLDVFFSVLQSAANTVTLSSTLSSLLILVEDSWGTPIFSLADPTIIDSIDCPRFVDILSHLFDTSPTPMIISQVLVIGSSLLRFRCLRSFVSHVAQFQQAVERARFLFRLSSLLDSNETLVIQRVAHFLAAAATSGRLRTDPSLARRALQTDSGEWSRRAASGHLQQKYVRCPAPSGYADSY